MRQFPKRRLCLNCKIRLDWGVLCIDCLRASVLAFAGGVGAALAAMWLRR